MLDREPHKRDRGANPKPSFCPTSGLITAIAVLPPALERRIVGFQEPASGESRLSTASNYASPGDDEMAEKTWQPTNATHLPLGGRTDDIWFIDEKVGWAVNSNGEVLATKDGGDTWIKQHQFPPRTWLRCVSFGSPTHGWIGTVTDTDRLYATTNAGQTWEKVTAIPSQPSAVCGLWAVNERVVFAAGTNWPNRPAAIIKTVDGGDSWELIEMDEQASLLVDIYFRDENVGWVVGGSGGSTRDQVKPIVLHTTDGGRSWTNQLQSQEGRFPKGEWGWKLQFIDEQTGFVSLENFEDAAILTTTTGGRAWQRNPVRDPQGNANLEGIGFLSKDVGWVGGWGGYPLPGPGYSSATADGGETWKNANEIGKYLNRFRFIGNPPTVAYSSGATVFKYAEHVEGALVTMASQREKKASASPPLIKNSDEETVQSVLHLVVQIPEGARNVEVNLWDRFGEHKGTLFREVEPAAGLRELALDLNDDTGERIADGHYIYRMNIDDSAESRIMIKKEASSAPDALPGPPGTVEGGAPPDLPSIEEEKEAFFKLANIEDYPEFLPIANRMAHAYLANADYSATALYERFEYSAEAFDERMEAIYEAVLPGMHQPHPYDLEVMEWSNGKRYKVGRASDRVIRDRFLQLAPFNLMDGVWLQRIMQAGPSDEVQARLFDIWADEVGNGKNRENHSNVYLDLLRSQGMYLAPVTSRDFLEHDFAPGAWRAPVFQMCIGVFPQEFFPELLGMTLFLEWEATPTLHPAAEMLRGRGINPLFYSLHVAIDNISEGHGALAKEAVKIFLDEKREEGGERSVQEYWGRIWNGYVGWATAGFNGAGLAERRLLIDKKSINIGTTEDPVCFPDFNKYYHDRMVSLVRRKAPYASEVHGRNTLGGELLNDLFGDPERLMQKLLGEGLLDVDTPRSSRFFELIAFEGPMYRVFTEEDKDVILDWLESLSDTDKECIDPLPEDTAPGGWPEKMSKLISDFSVIAVRAHQQLALPDESGEPVPLPDLFADPQELMRAMVRGGWVIPRSPDRSMFYTRILNNGGPMSGVLGQDGVEVVYKWILDGARAPGAAVQAAAFDAEIMSRHEKKREDSMEKIAAQEFRARRPFIGQGSVH